MYNVKNRMNHFIQIGYIQEIEALKQKQLAFAKQLVWEVDLIHRLIGTKSNHTRSRKVKCEWKSELC